MVVYAERFRRCPVKAESAGSIPVHHPNLQIIVQGFQYYKCLI